MDEEKNNNTEKEKKGVKVYSIIYQLMFQYLGKSSILPKEIFCKSKKLNNEYKEKRNMKFKSIYENIKIVEPIQFNYDKNDLYIIIEYMINTNQKNVLKLLVVPTKYFGYFDQINEEIYIYYLNSFKKLTKEQKIKKFENFLIKGYNYLNIIYMLDNIINSSKNIMNIMYTKRKKDKNENQNNENQNKQSQNIQSLDNDIENLFPYLIQTENYNNTNNNNNYTPNKNSLERKALKLKNYLLKNIYGLKKYKFENNYEYFLKEKNN